MPSESTYVKLRDSPKRDKNHPYENVSLAKSLDQLNNLASLNPAAPSKPPRRLSSGAGYVSRSVANLEAAESMTRLYPKLEDGDEARRWKECEVEAALALQVRLLELQEKWIQRREEINSDKRRLEEKIEGLERDLKRVETDFEKQCQELRSKPEFRTDQQVEKIMKELDEEIDNNNNNNNNNIDTKQSRRLDCPSCKRKIGHIYGCTKCDSMLCAVCSVALARCYNCELNFKEKPPKRNVLAERLL